MFGWGYAVKDLRPKCQACGMYAQVFTAEYVIGDDEMCDLICEPCAHQVYPKLGAVFTLLQEDE